MRGDQRSATKQAKAAQGHAIDKAAQANGASEEEESKGMTRTITIYSRKPCPQCDATYRAMDKAGIEYTSESADDNREWLEAQGCRSLPFVVVHDSVEGEDSWSGFRPDKIRELCS